MCSPGGSCVSRMQPACQVWQLAGIPPFADPGALGAVEFAFWWLLQEISGKWWLGSYPAILISSVFPLPCETHSSSCLVSPKACSCCPWPMRWSCSLYSAQNSTWKGRDTMWSGFLCARGFQVAHLVAVVTGKGGTIPKASLLTPQSLDQKFIGCRYGDSWNPFSSALVYTVLIRASRNRSLCWVHNSLPSWS